MTTYKRDELDDVKDQWLAAWREVQKLERDSNPPHHRQRRIAELKEQIARLDPLMEKYRQRQYFSGWRPGCGFPRPNVV